MSNAARKYPLFENDFFMQHVNLFMKTVMKNALQIEHYWGCVKFAPGKGAIHLQPQQQTEPTYKNFLKHQNCKKKAKVINNYAIKHLNMTADEKVSDNLDYRPDYMTSPLARAYSECSD